MPGTFVIHRTYQKTNTRNNAIRKIKNKTTGKAQTQPPILFAGLAPGFVAGTLLGWKNARIFFHDFETKKSRKQKVKVTKTPHQKPLLNSVSAATDKNKKSIWFRKPMIKISIIAAQMLPTVKRNSLLKKQKRTISKE